MSEGAIPSEPDPLMLTERVLARVQLADAAHAHLAQRALWLALINHDERCTPDLEQLLEGKSWAALFAPERERTVGGALLDRLALGVILQRWAAAPELGAALRTASALASVALGCVDPSVGLRLRRGYARLELLGIVEVIPVALRVRVLALEFRHLPLPEPPPPPFVARVEDLLEQLDALGLLECSLDEQRDVRGDPAEALLEVLLPDTAPQLRSLARALFSAAEDAADADALLALCREEDPLLWGEAQAEEVVARYAELRGLLPEGALALREGPPFGMEDAGRG